MIEIGFLVLAARVSDRFFVRWNMRRKRLVPFTCKCCCSDKICRAQSVVVDLKTLVFCYDMIWWYTQRFILRWIKICISTGNNNRIRQCIEIKKKRRRKFRNGEVLKIYFSIFQRNLYIKIRYNIITVQTLLIFNQRFIFMVLKFRNPYFLFFLLIFYFVIFVSCPVS
jgi:hypothetical protein